MTAAGFNLRFPLTHAPRKGGLGASHGHFDPVAMDQKFISVGDIQNNSGSKHKRDGCRYESITTGLEFDG